MWSIFIFSLLVIIFILVSVVRDKFFQKRVDISSSHILITGGSSGIGKALGIEAASRGANVTILARNQAQLEEAKKEIEEHALDKEKQKVTTFSVDISKEYQDVELAIQKAEGETGPIDILFNCAGTSIAHRFEEIPLSDFKRMIDVNYFGSVHVTKAVLPSMKRHKTGKIVFVSSMAGLFGLYGYSAYSAAKFALRGLAECLQMEVKPFNISITVAFPADTDTPGFAEEEKTKPRETREISTMASLLSPKHVASCILNDTLNGRFFSTVGVDGWVISTLCCGMSPASSIVEILTQVIFLGPFRLIGVICLKNFERIIQKCSKTQDENKKDN